MTRYATTEEKIICKNCMVEFTERELTENGLEGFERNRRSCPRCLQNPFLGLTLQELKQAFRRTDEQLEIMRPEEAEQFDMWWNDSGFKYDIEVRGG